MGSFKALQTRETEQGGFETRVIERQLDELPAGEVLRFRDQAFTEYFTSPSYLEMIQKKFGAGTVAEIKEMTSHTLVRQNV